MQPCLHVHLSFSLDKGYEINKKINNLIAAAKGFNKTFVKHQFINFRSFLVSKYIFCFCSRESHVCST